MLKNQLAQRWELPPIGLRFLIITLLVLGVFFRFVNLDRKVYWYDETFTSIRVSGYTEAEMAQQLSPPHVINIEALQKYQRPNSEKHVIDTIKGLAVEEPQHSPLYYVIVRFWVQWFGSSIAVTRSLSALISLLAFPSAYWLCLELFDSPLIGWVAVALIAVSPFHVLYAQEAREYSLWTVTILLSSAALLRAMRLKTPGSWSIYAVTLAVSFYAFLFSGLVAIGHGIYVAASERFRVSKTLLAYLIALVSSSLLFIPWLLVITTNLSQTRKATVWTQAKSSLLSMSRSWVGNLGRFFSDLNIRPLDQFIHLILLVLVGYALYFLYRNAPERVWLFIFTLIGATALSLVLPDLIFGGLRSTMGRYLIPSYLGIQLAVAYLLTTKLAGSIGNRRQQRLWQVVMIALVSCGVLSCTISSQAQTWPNKDRNLGTPVVAGIINQATHPLLISDTEVADILSLSYLLNPKVQLLLQPRCYTCSVNSLSEVKPYIPKKIPDGFSDVFIFHTTSEEWLHELEKEQAYKIEPVVKSYESSLLRLKNGKNQGA